MLFSNSAIIVSIDTKCIDLIKNTSFEDENKFYSLSIKRNVNHGFGEIHWAESFMNGKINIVSFIQIENIFIFFTSTVQNYLHFKKIVKHILGHDANAQLFKLPLPVTKKLVSIPNVRLVETNEAFGLTLILNNQNEDFLIKIYTNGLITYSMLINLSPKQALNMFKTIIKVIEVFNEKY
ncbi:hypothetical protein P6709_02060 [Jeotgalibacillus sp. ET6]|uniref:hypothetical protein n=1 Tax=Jeotgalibacillus sp. ET6 TaxID=3037260 RepID=UPI0024187321|nr:hypothetical protein [Jeotgalibacillus sp. ET6]MDG5470515.1 hypothetical protein [Jeotgalibacillus sp. ET6]